MSNEYALDKGNAKLMGVCAGLAKWTGVDPMTIRMGVVLMSVLLTPLTIMLYLIVGLIAPQD